MFARRCTISCASSIYTFLFMFRMWRETARKNVNEIPAWSVSRGRSRGRPCHGIETRSFLYFRLCEIFWDRQTRPDSCLRRSCISFLRGRKFTWIKEKWNYRSIFSRTFEEEVNGTVRDSRTLNCDISFAPARRVGAHAIPSNLL